MGSFSFMLGESVGFGAIPALVGWAVGYAGLRSQYTAKDQYKPHNSLIFLVAWGAAASVDLLMTVGDIAPTESGTRLIAPFLAALCITVLFGWPQQQGPGQERKPAVARLAGQSAWMPADWVLAIVVALLALLMGWAAVSV